MEAVVEVNNFLRARGGESGENVELFSHDAVDLRAVRVVSVVGPVAADGTVDGDDVVEADTD